jgi:hypothetical protein
MEGSRGGHASARPRREEELRGCQRIGWVGVCSSEPAGKHERRTDHRTRARDDGRVLVMFPRSCARVARARLAEGRACAPRGPATAQGAPHKTPRACGPGLVRGRAPGAGAGPGGSRMGPCGRSKAPRAPREATRPAPHEPGCRILWPPLLLPRSPVGSLRAPTYSAGPGGCCSSAVLWLAWAERGLAASEGWSVIHAARWLGSLWVSCGCKQRLGMPGRQGRAGSGRREPRHS